MALWYMRYMRPRNPLRGRHPAEVVLFLLAVVVLLVAAYMLFDRRLGQ